jgi:hypothetical protein
MNGRRVAIASGAALLAGALAWWAIAAFAPHASIDIEPSQIQSRLDARFPQKNCALLLACLTLEAPRVALAEGSDRIGLSADVRISLGHREATGRIAFSGVLRYVRYRGEFYLDDVRVDNFEFTGIPPELVDVVKVHGPAALRRGLEGHPIYTLRADSAQAALAKLAVRDVRVVHGKIRVTFLRFLPSLG